MQSKIRTIAEHIDETAKILSDRGYEPELPIKTMPKLNKILWGLRKGRVSVIASRPSHGKSAFVLQICRDLASQGKNILFLSLEMTVDEIIERLFCQHCRIDNQELLRGNFNAYQQEWMSFVHFVSTLPLVITDCIGKNWKEIDSLLTNLTTKPDVVVIDYIQNIAVSGRNQKEDIDEYIRHFEELTIRHSFAGILVSQINRDSQESTDKEPRLHHLKGSGKLEETPSVIMLLHRPWKYSQTDENYNKFTVFLEKNRNGITGVVRMGFTPENYLFYDIEEDGSRDNKADTVKALFNGSVHNTVESRTEEVAFKD